MGDKNGIAFYYWISGWAALVRGDAATAQAQMEQCLALFQEMEDRWHGCWAIAALGRIKAYRGDLAAALAFYEQSLAIARELNDDWLLATCLERWANVVAKQGKCELAAHLWGAAESLHERCGIPLLPLDHVDYEPAVGSARKELGEEAFAAAWAEGRMMTLEQVLAALEQTKLTTTTTAEKLKYI
jgi:tetratricopeptide (TPR) repeat protein